jgi:hypothetical protein
VVPWLLAPGRLLDAVRASAAGHGCPAVGDGLLREESLLIDIAARLSSRRVAAGC